jgi:uncharacterized protein YkwD
MLRALALVTALVAALIVPSAAANARKPPASRWDGYLAPADRCSSDGRAGMACLINWARERRGLPALRTEPMLESVAQLRAQSACAEFTHTPCGRGLISFFRDAGYAGGRRWLVGENIAMTSGTGPTDPRAIMRAWLASKDHRANIFFARFAEQGLGVVRLASFAGEHDVTLWASEFGWRAGAQAARRPGGHGRSRPRATRHRRPPRSGRHP